MKTRNRLTAIGLFSLVLCGSAVAHEPGYAGGNWIGSVSAWGNSQGYSGWTGDIGYVASYGYNPGFIAWATPLPRVPIIGHVHGPACNHYRSHDYGKKHWNSHGHGREHGDSGRRRGHEQDDRPRH